MVHQRVLDLCHQSETVTSALARDPGRPPHELPYKLYPKPNPFTRLFARYEVKKELHHGQGELTPDVLDKVASCGTWVKRPSDLFLKIFADVLLCLERDPMSGLVSPPLLASTGTLPLSIISVIPDIIQHYYDVIIRAEHEVVLATNYWQPSRSVTKISDALRELSKRAGEKGRKIVVKLMYDRGTPKQFVKNHSEVAPGDWKKVDLPGPEEIPNLQMEVINFHRPLLGTFHSKYLIVDRKVALLNSNNIQDRPMMVHFEGPIVNSFFDMSLLSWHNPLSPTLPSLLLPDQLHPYLSSVPNPQSPDTPYKFGKENPYIACKNIEEASKRARGELKRQHTELLKEIQRERVSRSTGGRGAELWESVRDRFHGGGAAAVDGGSPVEGRTFAWIFTEARERERMRQRERQRARERKGKAQSWNGEATPGQELNVYAARGSADGEVHDGQMVHSPSEMSPRDSLQDARPAPIEVRTNGFANGKPERKGMSMPDHFSFHVISPTDEAPLSPAPNDTPITEEPTPLETEPQQPAETPSRSTPQRVQSSASLPPNPVAQDFGQQGGPVKSSIPNGSGSQQNGSAGPVDDDPTTPGERQASLESSQSPKRGERPTTERNASLVAKVAAHLNLGNNSDVQATATEMGSPFRAHILHEPHEPFPIAMVNRRPHGAPGHQDIRTPQNAAWLGAFRYAQRKVLIQTPTFNASPVVPAALAACRRGVEVVLYLDLGFNDQGEMIPFQGGTNEQVVSRMYKTLKEEGKGHERNLKVYWYTGKDQIKPLNAKVKQRNCHVKFCAVDDQIGIVGNGNQDTQSWFHSQEINVMIDSPAVIKEWVDGLNANQNTLMYGLIDDDGIWRYRDGEMKGQPLEDLGGTKTGFFTSMRELFRMVQKARG